MSADSSCQPIDPQDIAAFHRDGAVLLKNCLDPYWVNILTQGLDFIHDHPDGMSAGVNMPLRIDQFPAKHSPDLQHLLDDSPIAEIVGTVLSAPVRFYMDQMFYKPPGPIFPSAWHQDTSYYNIEGHQVIRAWVCADPAPRDVSIEVVRGSHLWNITYRPPVGMDPAQDPEGAAQLERDFAEGKILIGPEAHEQWTYFDSFLDPSLPPLPNIEANRESFDILGWDYAPGDVLLFHGNILHSARGGAEGHILGELMLLFGPGRMCTTYDAVAKRFRTRLNFTILHPETASICQTLTKFSHWHGSQDWHKAMPSTQTVM